MRTGSRSVGRGEILSLASGCLICSWVWDLGTAEKPLSDQWTPALHRGTDLPFWVVGSSIDHELASVCVRVTQLFLNLDFTFFSVWMATLVCRMLFPKVQSGLQALGQVRELPLSAASCSQPAELPLASVLGSGSHISMIHFGAFATSQQ